MQQTAPCSIHNSISWKSKGSRESRRNERANMRQKERGKGSDGGATLLQSPRRMHKLTNYISYLNTGKEGIYLLTNPRRSKQNKLYHFDIKQGDVGEKERGKNTNTKQQALPLV